MPAAGHRADHHAIGRVQFIDHRARHVPQPARHSMSLHCGTNRFRNHQPDFWAVFCPIVRTQGVHHQIGLHRAHPSAHRRPEVARPRHPVPRRKHRASSWIGLRRQRATALAAPVRHNGPAGPGPHPQPEPVHPCPAPVVRLESPLALGHGSISLLRLAPAAHTDRRSLCWTRLPLVSSSVPLDRRGPHSSWVAAVPPRPGDCSRVLTSFAWVKPCRRPARTVTSVTLVPPRCRAKIRFRQCCGTVGTRPENC